MIGDPNGTYARIVADSVNEDGVRLTSLEIQHHRFILAEVNTHCVLARNSASSRAIPFKKQLARVMDNPAIPVSFPEERPGMQGGEELSPGRRKIAEMQWIHARGVAAREAQDLANMGVHKSVVNRILEPFQWHKVLITGTAFQNFFRQRDDPAAQPEFRVLAGCMREAFEKSSPVLLQEDEWHMPYLDEETISDVTAYEPNGADALLKISVARCARTSYMTQEGKRDYHEDLKLFERLVAPGAMHMSPLEHVATSALWNRHQVTIEDPVTHRPLLPPLELPKVGKFYKYLQYRHLHEARLGYRSFE